MRVCSTCGKCLSLESFIKDKNRKEGRRGICRVCAAEYRKANKAKIAEGHLRYRQANKGKISERNTTYRKANKERIAEWQIEYRKNHKEEFIQKEAEYRKNNRGKLRERGSIYRLNNKERFAAYEAKRRAIKLELTPVNVNSEAIQFYYTVCNETNEILGDVFFHVDHIQPLSKEGLHHEDNLQILEAELNRQKQGKWPLTNNEHLKYKGVTL